MRLRATAAAFGVALALGVALRGVNSQSGPEVLPPENLRIVNETDLDHGFYPGDFTRATVIGMSLPGTWRPFSAASPWNTPISANAPSYPGSGPILAAMLNEASNIRLAQSYSVPVWVVNSDNIPPVRVRSDNIFDWWDQDRDGWTDTGAPITASMWAEGTEDGHICIIDPFKKKAWEMSRFGRLADGTPTCTTYNVWEIDGRGHGDPNEGSRWQLRGGRGSGFPEVGGLIRPEELDEGEIRHALSFSYPMNRKADDGSNIFILPPACRSDGKYIGSVYPIEGMRLQLDPSLTEADFDAWGLNREGKIVARALQVYGMYLGDNGGAFALAPQLLAPTGDANRAEWDRRYPGFYRNVERIPTGRFRIVDTGSPTTKK